MNCSVKCPKGLHIILLIMFMYILRKIYNKFLILVLLKLVYYLLYLFENEMYSSVQAISHTSLLVGFKS